MATRNVFRFIRPLIKQQFSGYSTSISPASIGRATSYPTSFDNHLFPVTDVTSLSNGLRVTSENWNTPTCTVGVWVDVGSKQEDEKNNGVAHFLEHMAFKGTGKRSQQAIEMEVENKGAHLNAYTSREMTVYYAKCFVKDLPWAVELLSDILKNSKYDRQQVEREKGVVLREMEEVDSNYQEVVFDFLHATAYQGTPLGRTILGPPENVKAMTPDMLKSFVKNNYKAPKMVLAATGGIDHAQLKELGEKHFGDVVSSHAPDETPFVEQHCRFTGSELRERDDEMTVVHGAIAFQGPGWSNPDTLELMVASSLHGGWDRSYGGGSHVASSLAANFFERGNMHNFQHFFTGYHNTSMWGVYLAGEKLGMYLAVRDCMMEYVRMGSRLTKAEVERAKNQLKTHLVLQLDGTTPICEELGRQMLVYGRRIPMKEMLKRIDDITPDSIMEVCHKYFYDQCPAVSCIGPTEIWPDYLTLRGMSYSLRV